MPPTSSLRRLLALLFVAAALAGCGRRGPLELPPETQAYGAALKAQEEARLAKGRPAAAPGAAAPDRPAPPIPGTIGNRPPAQYPFLLDPLL